MRNSLLGKITNTTFLSLYQEGCWRIRSAQWRPSRSGLGVEERQSLLDPDSDKLSDLVPNIFTAFGQMLQKVEPCIEFLEPCEDFPIAFGADDAGPFEFAIAKDLPPMVDGFMEGRMALVAGLPIHAPREELRRQAEEDAHLVIAAGAMIGERGCLDGHRVASFRESQSIRMSTTSRPLTG